jgi:histidinol-phosphate/aromatic aminotransferase/cobyric acid decarboxylase-like protein
VNPFGPHPEVVRAIRGAALDRYPDRNDSRARAALARTLDYDPARIVIGHGSVELLWSLIGLTPRERPLLVVAPTFGEPEAAARAHGVRLHTLRMSEADDFALDPRAIDHAITRTRAGAIYLCQPNNPTGRALSAGALAALTATHPECLFILDQAFLSLSTLHAQAALRFTDNVVLVRSLTKDHALAGLRVGYALGAPELIRQLIARRPPWMISAPAQAAIEVVLQHPAHVRHARERLLEERTRLGQAIARLGFAVVPGETHFLLVRVADAEGLRARWLERARILIRSGQSFGLPEHIRLAAIDPTASARVLAALAQESPP